VSPQEIRVKNVDVKVSGMLAGLGYWIPTSEPETQSGDLEDFGNHGTVIEYNTFRTRPVEICMHTWITKY
jgi:hypothetical protein